MVYREPKVEFVHINLDEAIATSSNSNCGGIEQKPGGGVVCSNSYYITLYGDCGNNGGSAPQWCTIFCG